MRSGLGVVVPHCPKSTTIRQSNAGFGPMMNRPPGDSTKLKELKLCALAAQHGPSFPQMRHMSRGTTSGKPLWTPKAVPALGSGAPPMRSRNREGQKLTELDRKADKTKHNQDPAPNGCLSTKSGGFAPGLLKHRPFIPRYSCHSSCSTRLL